MSKSEASHKSYLHKAMQKSQAEKSLSVKLLASRKRILVMILILGMLVGAYYVVYGGEKLSLLAALEQMGVIKQEAQPIISATLKEGESAPGKNRISDIVKKSLSNEPGQNMPVSMATTDDSEKFIHVLDAVFVEETWLRILIDGLVEQEYLFKPGDSMSWRAKKYFKLRIGNAGGLKLILNGEPLPSLGVHAQVREVTLPGAISRGSR